MSSEELLSVCVFLFFSMLGTEFRSSQMPHIHSTTESEPQALKKYIFRSKSKLDCTLNCGLK